MAGAHFRASRPGDRGCGERTAAAGSRAGSRSPSRGAPGSLRVRRRMERPQTARRLSRAQGSLGKQAAEPYSQLGPLCPPSSPDGSPSGGPHSQPPGGSVPSSPSRPERGFFLLRGHKACKCSTPPFVFSKSPLYLPIPQVKNKYLSDFHRQREPSTIE